MKPGYYRSFTGTIWALFEDNTTYIWTWPGEWISGPKGMNPYFQYIGPLE